MAKSRRAWFALGWLAGWSWPERLIVLGLGIAPIVGRSTDATRQLASRARRRVRGAETESDVSVERQREVIDAFLAAARAGDFEALLQVLDPDIVARADDHRVGERDPCAKTFNQRTFAERCNCGSGH